MEILPDRLPWYVTGPLLGLLVTGLFVVANQPLGASGAYMQTMKAARGDADTVVWRVWYFVGIAIGGIVATALGPGFDARTGFDAMFEAGWSKPVVAVVVFVAAVAMGYGARMAGGCTSGHGICGTAQRSPASFATTASFVGTAIAVTFVLTSFTSLGDLALVDGMLRR